MSDQFWGMFAAVLGANLATAAFVWGAAASYLQHRNGDRHEWGKLPVFAMLIPVLFLGVSMYLLDQPLTQQVKWEVQRDTATLAAAPGATN